MTGTVPRGGAVVHQEQAVVEAACSWAAGRAVWPASERLA
jgi:hypothetical protein